MKKARLLVLLALAGVSYSCHPTTVTPKVVLHGDGSASLFPLVKEAASRYSTAHANVAVDVVESGSGAGIKRFVDQGDLDFANSSRALKESELDAGDAKGKSLHATVVAAEGIIVVVNPNNPVANLSVEQLKAIYFSGTTTSWVSLGGTGEIHAFAIDPKKSGTGDFFVEHVGGKDAKFAVGARVLERSDMGADAVAADPAGLAYCSSGVALAAGSKVRVLSVGGVVPSERTVLDTSYPLNRKLFVITDGPPRGEVGGFIKYLLSEDGQRLARAKGYTPVALGGAS